MKFKSEVQLEALNNATVDTDKFLVSDGDVVKYRTGAQLLSDIGSGVFVPYTGATSDVNLGEFGVQLGNLEFDLTPTNAPTTVGSMYWNDPDGTADLILKGGNVTLQIGQETVARVVNKTATNITLLEANYQAVRVTGAQGQRPKVDLAQADNDLDSASTLGLVTETILINQEGFITTSGQVREINTTGSLQGETWLDGDILYLSGTVAGRITNIKPIAPIHTVIIGFVEYAHAIHGKIFVKVNNGYELEELHNVSAVAPNNNEVLVYDTPSLLWTPKTIPTILGYTPADDSNVVHKTFNETIVGTKTFNGTLNTTTSIFNLAAVDNFPTGGVPDAIRSYINGHNGTSGSFVSSLYGVMQNSKNVGVWIDNPSTVSDAVNSIGFRVGFKSTSTTNDFFIGSRGSTNVFRVNDYGDIYGTKTILGTTVDNTIDTLQVNGSARIVNIDPTGIGGITTKLLSYSADPYGLVFRAYVTGEHSIQNQKESSDATLFPLILQPLGGNLGVGTLIPAAKLDVNGDALINGITVGIGNGSIVTNTVVGNQSLLSNLSSQGIVAIGYNSLTSNLSGSYNTSIGSNSMSSTTSGNSNTALGERSLQSNTTGSNNVALGIQAGRFINGGVTLNTNPNLSIFLGSDSRALADSQTNQVVIGGSTTTGLGSNTTTIGNSSTIQTWLGGKVTIGTTVTSARLSAETSMHGPINPQDRAAIYANNISTDATFANSIGLYAKSATTGGFAVYGENTSTGYGGYFLGKGYFSNSVGFGTTTVGSSIQINGNAAIGYSASTVAPASGLVVNGNVGIGTITIGSKLQINGNAAIGFSASTAAPANGMLVSGNVGIGTTSPSTKLHVVGTISVEGTTPSINTITAANSTGYFQTAPTTLTNQNFALIRNSATINGNITRIGLFVAHGTSQTQGITIPTPEIFLTQANKNNIWLFASTAAQGASQINSRLQVGYDQFLPDAANTNTLSVGGNGYFTSTVSATGFVTISDNNLKDIISKDGDTVRFTWKNKQDNQVHIGYIAQEIQKIYPDQVHTSNDGTLSVNYIEVLVAKLQDLTNEIKELKNKITILENK